MKEEIFNYDNLTLYVKKNKVEEIVQHYKIFGWQLVKSVENDRYEDLVDLTFVRPHKIVNKDDLQLYQVYMEEKLNEAAKTQRRRHLCSTLFAFNVGLIGLTLIILGIITLTTLTILNVAGGIVFVCLGTMFFLVEALILPKIVKKENKKYAKKKQSLDEEIDSICEKVVILRGAHE